MRVEIVEIGKGDAHYGNLYTHTLIGLKGTLATKSIDKDGFADGQFYRDDTSNFCYFVEVKTKPIFDA